MPLRMQSAGAGIAPNNGCDVSPSSTKAAALPASEIASVCIGSVSTSDNEGFNFRIFNTAAIIFGFSELLSE